MDGTSDSRSVLGVDGGGTRTRAVRLENGVEAARVFGDATNPLTVGVSRSAERLVALLEDVAGTPAPCAIGIGVAGVGSSSSAREEITHSVAEAYPGASVVVTSDVIAALAGAFDGGPGVLVVGGTGSVAVGFDGERCYRAGGWGRRLGDDGSGYDLMRRAVRLVLSQLEGASRDEPSASGLGAALVQRLELDSVRDLIPLFARDPEPSELLSAVESIVRCADEGDAAAARLLEGQGRRLASLVVSIADRWQPEDRRAMRVATIGGLIASSSAVRKALEVELARSQLALVPAMHDAAVGAATLARASVGAGPAGCAALLSASRSLFA